MRMHIRPGSIWLAYALTQPRVVEQMIPSHLRLSTAPLLGSDPPHMPPRLLFNAYDVASPWMCGRRVDILVMTCDVRTGTQHLVILDCLSNTLQWNPVDGVVRANAFVPYARPTGDCEFHVRNFRDELRVHGRDAGAVDIDWRFAVEANRACYWRAYPVAYRMSFNETCVASPVQALQCTRVTNTLWSSVREADASHAFYHAHAMEFDVDVDRFRRV